jgi:hypothetical protein
MSIHDQTDERKIVPSVLQDRDGLVAFGNGDYSRRTGTYTFRTAHGDVPAAGLIGCRVNLGTKDGVVFEATTVTAADRDELVLEGGRMGWPYQPSQAPEPVRAGCRIAITEIARGYTRPVADVDVIRKRLTGVELQYRFSGSLHHVAGYGAEYGAIRELADDLRLHPHLAAEHAARVARYKLENSSTSGCVQRADLIGYILDVLDGIEHTAPAYVTDALRVYLRVLRGEDLK